MFRAAGRTAANDVDQDESDANNGSMSAAMYLLSPNFTLEELLHSDTAKAQGIINAPNWDILVQLVLLTNNTLEGIRHVCGDNPVLVSSGYRNEDLNDAVGGAQNSAHLYGCAADFTIPNFGSPIDVCNAVAPYLAELEIDQLIHENGTWVHVGRVGFGQVPRQECLTINSSGTYSGFV